MGNGLLQHIRDLQYTNRGEAEALLLGFLKEVYRPDVTSVEIRTLAISLNSFNGFLTLANGESFFFKSHTETDTVIGEYYQAELLDQAGYPIIKPIFRSSDPGKQILIYERIQQPAVFDVAWAIENGNQNINQDALQNAQIKSDRTLLNIYCQTLKPLTAESNSTQPIHQLFHHRITQGRFDRFYGGGCVALLPNGEFPMKTIMNMNWTINGQTYHETLGNLVKKAEQLLHPNQATLGVVGHGDAHNGNVFFDEDREHLTFFDPAFAGYHSPLLDLVKPLFHNVFAMWMYFPSEKAIHLNFEIHQDHNRWIYNHDYRLHGVRRIFLESKKDYLLKPIIKHLAMLDALPMDYRAYLKLALMCCPLLTMNLTDRTRFSPSIALLGFAMAIEMGAESNGRRSLIDQVLDEVDSTG